MSIIGVKEMVNEKFINIVEKIDHHTFKNILITNERIGNLMYDICQFFFGKIDGRKKITNICLNAHILLDH